MASSSIGLYSTTLDFDPMAHTVHKTNRTSESLRSCSARHVDSYSVAQCRFAYATWCPVCEYQERTKKRHFQGRRRSKSEGMDGESRAYQNIVSNRETSISKQQVNECNSDFSRGNQQYSRTILKNEKNFSHCDYFEPSHEPNQFRSKYSTKRSLLNFHKSSGEKPVTKSFYRPCENHIEPNRAFENRWNSSSNSSEWIYPWKEKDKSQIPLNERYYHEVEVFRNKLHRLRDSTFVNKEIIPVSNESEDNALDVKLKRPRDDSPSFGSLPSSARKVLPTIPPLKNTVYRPKSALQSRKLSVLSSEPSVSDSSDSEYNDSGCDEEDLKDGSEIDFEEDESAYAETLKTNNLNFPFHQVESDLKTELGDASAELGSLHPGLRASLFSHVPPYIRFSSHDVKGPALPTTIQKLLKWKLSTITPVVVRKTVANSNFKLVRKSNEWCGTWGKHMKSLCFKTLRENQKMNHFPGTFQIGRKDRLWKNLFRLMTKFGKKEFGFIPRTYVLPQDNKLLRSAWEKNCGKERWIVKPPASARGTGIKVIHKWTQIPKKCPLVVQKYVADPYLINGSKFDLRLYVLVTSINPLRIYLYDNGLVRFASVKYSNEMTSLSDRYMHLTNYSINKLSSQYTQNEDASACQGHKWTLQAMWAYLEKEHRVDVKVLKAHLVDLVIKTVISGESPISQLSQANLASRYCSYELFGVDVLFDENLKPWLLEVNISPSLHSSSPLDLAVKGPLVRELLNIAGYHIPNKLSEQAQTELASNLGLSLASGMCLDRRLYSIALSSEERNKHATYQQSEARTDYLDSILQDLTPDDVRHLVQYEDELTQVANFQKIFPTTETYDYHHFFEGPRYYNMLFDAWEVKQSRDRSKGIALLESLCQKQIHLDTTQIPPKRTKVSMSPSGNNLIEQDLLEDIPEVCEEVVHIETPSKSKEKWTVACGTICRAVRPRSGKLGIITKPYPPSAYTARRVVKSAHTITTT